MQLNHLNLRVADIDHSARFYGRHFGFAVAQVEDDFLLLHNADGFVLALELGEAPPDPGAIFHFGFGMSTPGAVHDARRGLAVDGCPELEWHEGDSFVSVKVADPDGYVIEVFWEQ